MPKKETQRCKYCGEEFKPHVRLKQRQISCFKKECQKVHKRYLNHRLKSKTERLESNFLYRKHNKDKISDRNRKYYQKNKYKFWDIKN